MRSRIRVRSEKVDSDPDQCPKAEPNPNRIRIKVKIRSHEGSKVPWRVSMLVVPDFHYFDEELDPDPHQSDADPDTAIKGPSH